MGYVRLRSASQSSFSGQSSSGPMLRVGNQSGADEPRWEERRAMKVTEAREIRQSIRVIALLRKSIVCISMVLKGRSSSVEGMTGIDIDELVRY